MSLSPRLEARQTQSLVMTPELRQSIGLLKLNTMELRAFIDNEIETNPFLDYAQPVQPAAKKSEAETPTFARGSTQSEPTAPQSSFKDNAAGSASASGDHYIPDVAAEPATKRESLLQQIRLMAGETASYKAAALIIEELEDDGYLRVSLDDISAETGLAVSVVEAGLALVQSCEPVGIGARSLPECFALQLKDLGLLDDEAQAILNHLSAFARGGISAVATAADVNEKRVAAVIERVRGLNPNPGAAFDNRTVAVVTPDVAVTRNNMGGWQVELLRETLPTVSLNANYATEVSAAGDAASDYVQKHTRRANWLIRSLQQRASTLLRVATEIVRVQEDFFSHGPSGLKPLTLKAVAEPLGIHESTASRITRGKYLTCERGTLELRYFFSGALSSLDGSVARSALSVQERIREMIAAEETAKPLSDLRIATVLGDEGVDIARRTVTKYREAMRIPSSFDRKRRARNIAGMS